MTQEQENKIRSLCKVEKQSDNLFVAVYGDQTCLGLNEDDAIDGIIVALQWSEVET